MRMKFFETQKIEKNEVMITLAGCLRCNHSLTLSLESSASCKRFEICFFKKIKKQEIFKSVTVCSENDSTAYGFHRDHPSA